MRCLKQAEQSAEDVLDWTRCSETWMSVFNNNREAMRCLSEAEIKATYAFDWGQCAEAWKSIFNNHRVPLDQIATDVSPTVYQYYKDLSCYELCNF